MALARGQRRWFFMSAAIVFVLLFAYLLHAKRAVLHTVLNQLPIPGRPKEDVPEDFGRLSATELEDIAALERDWKPRDNHPISRLIAEADRKWSAYIEDRSHSFSEAVARYRRKNGRHPPPGFVQWYKYARERKVYNIDDFDQIMDDLRPFWAVPPQTIRALAAHMWEPDDAISGIHIRGGKVVKNNRPSWRPETMISLIERFVTHLPDMDIAVNVLDQPRVVVPWDDLQQHLETELETRKLVANAVDEFTPHMQDLLDWEIEPVADDSPREDPGWFNAPGRPYMDLARAACPPESHANNGTGFSAAEASWKDPGSGIVTNFNLSTDLCTMGPEIADKHGFLFSSSSIRATWRLVPVFGECKVNVNNDILFPANMYWRRDVRYDYDGAHDVEWEDKEDLLLWRGVTSGGVQLADNWERMHRQRLVLMTNATEMTDKVVGLYAEKPKHPGSYGTNQSFQPSSFLENRTDVAFVEAWGCFPDCGFYDGVMEWRDPVPMDRQFGYKYLIDVDGHSFSGRWRAFLRSRALGIKATIFKEWHDSRLFAWRHFVPLDNRYTEIFSVLGYFMGIGNKGNGTYNGPYIPQHSLEGKKLALQGREWASKVLRSEDIEVYMYRLLLEYGRIIDDNRDRIGYSGDGSEVDAEVSLRPEGRQH